MSRPPSRPVLVSPPGRPRQPPPQRPARGVCVLPAPVASYPLTAPFSLAHSLSPFFSFKASLSTPLIGSPSTFTFPLANPETPSLIKGCFWKLRIFLSVGLICLWGQIWEVGTPSIQLAVPMGDFIKDTKTKTPGLEPGLRRGACFTLS